MDKYKGYTSDGELDELIERVKGKVNSEVSGNSQIRPESESFFKFANRGANSLKQNPKILGMFHGMKGGNI